ncbi:hypothetical protein [Formosa sp. S-31]|uniref:hypothetical protein n=1 Tax=Formosa sp. S-31 TaxID=2790949 RepID=UPI003EBC422C
MIKSISYIFHPLFMPFACVLFYFSKSPRYIPFELIKYKVFSLFILTIIIPLLSTLVLKLLGRVDTIQLSRAKERILPLLIYTALLFIIIKRVILPEDFIELYYFFIGIIFSTLTCVILLLVNYKASIHIMALSGLFMFFIALSVHFHINIIGSIALISILLGATATSRLQLRAHTPQELVMGFFIGLLPQLLLVPYWL